MALMMLSIDPKAHVARLYFEFEFLLDVVSGVFQTYRVLD